MDLFAEQEQAALRRVQPLAVRMRPRTLDEFVGQPELLGPGKLLRRLLDGGCMSSAVFYGPPGSGKTTLARLIAGHFRGAWETLHAAESGVKDVRAVIERATQRLITQSQRTVLFLDEIHRFNRGQQDVLLRDVEEGTLTLIGATTENPFHAVNGPLVSRSQVFKFEPLGPAEIRTLLERALADEERGLGRFKATCDEDALALLAERAGGDARRALAALEAAVLSERAHAAPDRAPAEVGPASLPAAAGTEARPTHAAGRGEPAGGGRGHTAAVGGGRVHVTAAVAAQTLQQPLTPYDITGDTHYDMASAFIKSMRGSDPDAALYWMARMLEGGEDPRFIARRIAILASEDIGNADPRALLVASAAAQVVEFVGLPECQLTLSQAVIYMACAPKSNSATTAIGAARKDVQTQPPLPVPPYLRDASYGGAARLGHGQGYEYPHNYPEGWVAQDYLGAARRYYNPSAHGEEPRLAAQLQARRAAAAEGPAAPPASDA